ncbi:hypothetical protein M405DRAFT_828211 [Rhizopogon salebrosus TDB-379]|nr:hypothetical protein M405DRAFT_828211 [Rhizopogon salebrosus TDB-379]
MRTCHSNLPKGHLFNVKPVALKLKVPHRTTDENPQDSHFCSKWQACRLTAFTTPPVGYGADLVAVCPKNVTREHVPTEPESLHIFRRVVLPQAIGLSVPLRVRCSEPLARPPSTSTLHLTSGYMSPRPILKHRDYSQRHETFPFPACSLVSPSRHVHFPPTPTLTSTYAAHSSATYDRSPVAVPPNQCALPGRHEREFACSGDNGRAEIKGSYFHPRAYEASSPEPSVSDESDSSMVTPADTLLFVRFTSADSMIPFTHAQDESDSDTPCTFLQHPNLLGKEKRRRQGGSRRKGATHQGGNQSAFSVPSLDFDGCLGGF